MREHMDTTYDLCSIGEEWNLETRARKLAKDRNGNYKLPFLAQNITITISIAISRVSLNPRCCIRPAVGRESETLYALYANTKVTPLSPLVDAVLICADGGRIPVHRGVIAQASPVLYKILESELAKVSSTNQVHIRSVGSKALQAIVEFAYLKKVNTNTFADENDTLAILQAAHLFWIEPLVMHSEKCMVDRLLMHKLMHCVLYFRVADLYELKVLKNVAAVVILDLWTELQVSTNEELHPYLVELTERLAERSRSQTQFLHNNLKEDARLARTDRYVNRRPLGVQIN